MTTDPDILYGAHLNAMQSRATIALERGNLDCLVVPSGMLHYQVFDDRDYPYAVNPQFKAWVPLIRNPGSWLVFTPGKRPLVIYLQPLDYWHVVPETPGGTWVEHVDVVIVRTPEEALQQLTQATHGARCAILGEPQSALGPFVPNNPPAVIAYLEYQRAFKTPYEIQMMRGATRAGVLGHRAAETAFREGKSEFDIHLAYCAAARQDASDLPYKNIVALDRHGAVLHYTELDRLPPASPRSFLIDAGASQAGYACDITRTYSSDTSDAFQSLVDAVDVAQQGMCAQVRAGFDYRQLHLDAHLALAGVLQGFGIINTSPEAAVASGVSTAFFPHGVGHGIGLQVHEVAGFAQSDRGGTIPKPDGHPFLRLTRVLQPGMAVTIEPGLYFIDMLLAPLRQGPLAGTIDWKQVDAFHPFGGIRIEDDVVCTDGAPINLTREGFAQASA